MIYQFECKVCETANEFNMGMDDACSVGESQKMTDSVAPDQEQESGLERQPDSGSTSGAHPSCNRKEYDNTRLRNRICSPLAYLDGLGLRRSKVDTQADQE